MKIHCIDNIFCKASPSILQSHAGIIVSSLSDHFPCFISIKKKHILRHSPPNKVKMILNTDAAKKRMLDDLTNAEIHTKLENNLCSNPNDNYNLLEKHLMSP